MRTEYRINGIVPAYTIHGLTVNAQTELRGDKQPKDLALFTLGPKEPFLRGRQHFLRRRPVIEVLSIHSGDRHPRSYEPSDTYARLGLGIGMIGIGRRGIGRRSLFVYTPGAR